MQDRFNSEDQINLHLKENSMDRLTRARQKHYSNLVDFVKNHVNKITQKFHKSEENLKKIHQLREKIIKSKGESRDNKIQKILIKRHEKNTSKRFYEAFTPVQKKTISRSASLPRIRKEDYDEQKLEKINKKLESSFDRAQVHKKSISASASSMLKKSSLENSASLSLQILLEKQRQVYDSKKEFHEKIANRLKTVNQSKSKTKEKSAKKLKLEMQNFERVTLERISSESVKLDKLRKTRQLHSQMSAERWKVKKENQLQKFFLNRRLAFNQKEKILEKALKSHPLPEFSTPKSHDISSLKFWRDSELYKQRIRLIK
jgi:hypothetical protein